MSTNTHTNDNAELVIKCVRVANVVPGMYIAMPHVGHVVRVSRELDRVFSAFDNEHGYDRRIPEITANIRDIAKVRH